MELVGRVTERLDDQRREDGHQDQEQFPPGGAFADHSRQTQCREHLGGQCRQQVVVALIDIAEQRVGLPDGISDRAHVVMPWRKLHDALLEAAATLGVPPFMAFVRVTLPRLVHALRSGGLLVAFYCLSDFGAVSLLQYDTFSRAIFMQLEGAFDRSLAALWSVGQQVVINRVLPHPERTRARR